MTESAARTETEGGGVELERSGEMIVVVRLNLFVESRD